MPASGPDLDTLSFSIASGDPGGVFAIDSSGTLSVANAAGLDFESSPSFALTIEIDDAVQPSPATTALTYINLVNINEPPQIADASFELAITTPNGTSVGALSASDPESNITSYQILAGNADSAFAINTNGDLTVADNTLQSRRDRSVGQSADH